MFSLTIIHIQTKGRKKRVFNLIAHLFLVQMAGKTAVNVDGKQKKDHFYKKEGILARKVRLKSTHNIPVGHLEYQILLDNTVVFPILSNGNSYLACGRMDRAHPQHSIWFLATPKAILQCRTRSEL